jgi:ubiquinone/menaquinone biosynthesis C-methylase UbiE
MSTDPYRGFAERYDWMKEHDPAREQFFRQLFAEHGASTVLDCACGTGRDLITFHRIGMEVCGSDLSDAMLAQARKRIEEAHLDISIRKASYSELPRLWDGRFDAVVCLSNSVNEALEDAETLRALRSMRAVLRPGGILVLDQGQTDSSMRDPPRFVPVVNNRDFTRFFVIDYAQDIQTVHIFDFVHSDEACGFQQATVRLRIRLRDSWDEILRQAGFVDVAFFGDWDGTPYDKASSRRLIVVARA